MRSTLTELLRKPKVPPEWGSKHVMWVHDDDVSPHELVMNSETFPAVKVGDCVALVQPTSGRRICILVSSTERGPFKQSSFQLSLHRQVAEQLGFESRGEAYVRLLTEEETPRADAISIRFRDQYIGRLPMQQIKESLLGSGVYVGKRIELPNACVKAKIDKVYEKPKTPILSAVVDDPKCVVNFHSETAKMTILIQISQESLEWDSLTGQTFLEKAIDGFLTDLFNKWKKENVNHIVSILLHTRVIADSGGSSQDLYSVAIQWESYTDWIAKIPLVRSEAASLVSKSTSLGSMVSAKDGNFLEAVHLALMIFDKHYLDRDLSKTGMSIVSVTPGSGHFIVDDEESYDLCRLAKRKVIDDGIWLQLICLAPPPLHATPLLEIVKRHDRILQKYYRPYWMQCGYYEGESQWEGEPFHTPRTLRLYSDLEISQMTTDMKSAEIYEQPKNTPSDISLPSLLSSEGSSPTQWEPSRNYNPCNPTKTRLHHCPICAQKWGLLVAKLDSIDDLEHFPPNWETLIAPPCLPLRTKFEVNQGLLDDQFTITMEYSVMANVGSIFLIDSPSSTDLKEELAALRIAFGFQESFWSSHDKDISVLISGHEIHCIGIIDDLHVNVQIYHRKRRDKSMPMSVSYAAHVKPRLHTEYSLQDLDLYPSSNDDYPWEEVDRMIAGVGNKEIAEGHSWQSRFILIPAEEAPRSSLIMATAANEILDDEELRIAGFLKFMEAFQRTILCRPSPTSRGEFIFRHLKDISEKQSSIETLKVQLTTASCSAFVQQEVCRIESLVSNSREQLRDSTKREEEVDRVVDVRPLDHNSPIEHVSVMMQHPLVGLGIKNRRWHWKMYEGVFIGSAAVDWIIKFFDGMGSRTEAVEYGNTLMEKGVWEHIFGTHRFLDGHYFYRFSPQFDIGTLRKGNPTILKTISSREEMNACSEACSVIHPVIMSRTAVINVDLQKRSANRREWAFLHYDSTHNPKNTFHFRLHWLTCSSRLIDDLIQSWARRAFQCGFIMLEAPVELPGSLEESPFHTPLPIEFSVLPPCVKELNGKLGPSVTLTDTFFAEELLRKHGFVLDFEKAASLPEPDEFPKWRFVWTYDRRTHKSTQYVHRSGVALVKIEGDRLLWTSNRLLLASTANRTVRPSQASQFFTLEEIIRKEFVAFCSDPEKLNDFWRSTITHLAQKVGIDTILDNIPDDLAEGARGSVESPENMFNGIVEVEELLGRSQL